MRARLVLDAGAFDVLDTSAGTGLRAVMRRASTREWDVCCAAVTLAEVCRGRARTRRVEAALARDRGGRRIRVISTDEQLAKLVGAIMDDTHSGSDMLADAHVVAVCAGADHAVVVTVDPHDIVRLATALRGVRIVTRSP